MPQHYPKSTVWASAYCPTCNRETPHYVFDGRLGRCKNDHPHPGPEKKPEDTQGKWFPFSSAENQAQFEEFIEWLDE